MHRIKGARRGRKRDQRLRLHHCGGRLGRLRARQPVDRGRRRPRPAARGRPPRSPPLHFDPARHGPHARPGHVRLGLRDRGRAQSQRPHDRGDARQGAGRLVLDQCHGVYPRQPRRLRPLGAEGCAGMVLCRRAALFPARRDLGGRRRSVARRRRPARHPICEDARHAVRGLARGRQGRRHSGDAGLQRRDAGRLRPRAIHHPRWAALVLGARLSAAGAPARKS